MAIATTRTSPSISVLELPSGSSSPLSTSTPAHSPQFWSKSLAWLVGPGTSGQLWFRNTKGSRPLTDGIMVSHPTIAAGAKRVAVQINAVDPQGRVMGSDVATLDLNPGSVATLRGLLDGWAGKYLTVTSQASLPAISPDGQRVAFISQEASGPQLVVQEVAGGKKVAAPLGDEVRELVWIAPANALLALVRRADVTELLRIDPANPGAAPVVIATRKGSPSLLGFAAEGTGRRLVVATANVAPAAVKAETTGDLWLYDGAGGVVAQLVSDGSAAQPALTENGGAVAYLRAEAAGRSVWQIALPPLPAK